MSRDVIPKDWLQAEVTVADAEAANPGPANRPLPFGGLNAEWIQLKAQMQPGDQLWTFVSSQDSWKHLAGRAGIALVRDGAAIAILVTLMN